jgi:hypothetical protein
MITNQRRKYSLGLAGEFFVAAELQRRGITASITYGNAKKADVVALSVSGSVAVVLEVKTTSELTWVVGGTIPDKSQQLWVFVHLPKDDQKPPRYFILTDENLHDILMPVHQTYLDGYRKKHDCEFTGACVFKLPIEKAMPFEGKWKRIIERVSNN